MDLIAAILKVTRVINSCLTLEHTLAAEAMINNFGRMFTNESVEFSLRNNLAHRITTIKSR